MQRQDPYMQVTTTCLERATKDLLLNLGSMRSSLRSEKQAVWELRSQNTQMESELKSLREHASLTDGLLVSALTPFATRVQALVRSRLSRRHVSRMRKSKMNNAQYTACVILLQKRWRDIKRERDEYEQAGWDDLASSYGGYW